MLRWADDGGSVYVAKVCKKALDIERVNAATGKRQVWHHVSPPDQTGLLGINSLEITPDGQTYGYTSSNTSRPSIS